MVLNGVGNKSLNELFLGRFICHAPVDNFFNFVTVHH